VPAQTDFATLQRRWNRTKPENGGLSNNIDDRRGGMGPAFQRRLLNTMSARQRALSVYRQQAARPLNELSANTTRAPFGRFSVVKNPAPAKAFPSQALGRSKKGELAARAARTAAKANAKAAKAAAKPKPKPRRKPKSAEDLIAQSNRIDQRSRRMSRAARTGFRARQIESRAEGAVKAARARAVELSRPKPESKTAKAKRERAERVRAREQAVNTNRLIMEARRRRR
jgi:membrane-bound lytic murein transglycosylase